jgi:hypothetical protein
MTGMRSNRPLLSADIQRVVSNVLALARGGLSLACAHMLSDGRCSTRSTGSTSHAKRGVVLRL